MILLNVTLERTLATNNDFNFQMRNGKILCSYHIYAWDQNFEIPDNVEIIYRITEAFGIEEGIELKARLP